MEWEAVGSDFGQLKELGQQYNDLLDEKFELIERLRHYPLRYYARISLRLQIADIHHELMRTDDLRNGIAFGWVPELKYELCAILIPEMEDAHISRPIATTKPRAHVIDNSEVESLKIRLEEETHQKNNLRRLLNKANSRLKEYGFQPVSNHAESFDILPAINRE